MTPEDNDDDAIVLYQRLNWGRVAIAAGVVLFLAILLMLLVSTADFGDSSTTTVPRTPGACEPFCTNPPPGG